MKHRHLLIAVFVVFFVLGGFASLESAPRSRTIAEVLRDPLPPESLSCSEEESAIVIQGPTFRYRVEKSSGAIVGLEAVRQGQVVVRFSKPADLWVDDVHLAGNRSAATTVVSAGRDKVVLAAEGTLRPGLAYAMEHTFYNDGVVVSGVKLRAEQDLALRRGIWFEAGAVGPFSHYLHKRRDTEGMDCFKGDLPKPGETARLTTLTSCLEVFSPEAALAIFTDRGGSYRLSTNLETARLQVDTKTPDEASVALRQCVVHVDPTEPGYTLPAGGEFAFRTGLAVAPNRLPHARWRDLRMFIWIGDEKHPYPSDEEIVTAARLGFTLFQMHRLGTPGEPRPPTGELDRVLRTVRDAGMLFIWTANADLLYASAEGVKTLRAEGKWPRWQGFNYGGRYKAAMDSYCDLLSTCLASPNGLAEYRLACKSRMLQKYPVDGMYIDDNLAYANCPLGKEHGHPEKVYDCLIELHEMNWRRRQLLLSKCPHAVLIDHCSRAFVLPVISAFDVHLYGEGDSFASVENYWNTVGSVKNMPAQGCLYPGDTETTRCGTEIAYAFDLLTGGGQYCYLDWRLWPKKFPYAAGARAIEPRFVQTYNLAQFYFGMYESTPYYFARSAELFSTTTPGTYATLYENTTWNECLVVVANTGNAATNTSILFRQATKIAALAGEHLFAVYDVGLRSVRLAQGSRLADLFTNLPVGPSQARLFSVRGTPRNALYHLWGGKRISEAWDRSHDKLLLQIHGPAGLEDRVVLGSDGLGVKQVMVDGSPAQFFVDPLSKMIHGIVKFGPRPISIEVAATSNDTGRLSEAPLPPTN